MQASIRGPEWASTNCCLMVGRVTERALSIVKDMTETINTCICTGGTLVAWCKHKSHLHNCILHECSLVTLTLNSLFIRAGEFWRVSTEMGKEAGWLRSKVEREEDQLTPPLHGWQYWDGRRFESDPTLVCSREVSSPCREVGVVKLARHIVSWILNQ